MSPARQLTFSSRMKVVRRLRQKSRRLAAKVALDADDARPGASLGSIPDCKQPLSAQVSPSCGRTRSV